MKNPNSFEHEMLKKPAPKYYIIDGKVYDLSEWINKHPGGSTWFARSNGRDISVAMHAYHKEPQKLQRLLKNYEVDIPVDKVLHPSMNVPAFIVPKGFDARKHIQTYRWTSNDFLSSLKEKIHTDEMKQKIAKADFWFDFVGANVCIFHFVMMFVGVYFAILPAWAFIILFAITRTSMAAVGHYHCHRKKNGIADWGDFLFDMQYIGAGVIIYDGHVMLHHLYTNSQADVKRTVFTGMLELPRLWRIPIYTAQRFGQFLTGVFIRWAHTIKKENLFHQWPILKHAQFLTVHAILVVEFMFCWATGHLWMWLGQFLLCMWWNLFLIVSSHDFEESESKADLSSGQDWAIYQIKNSFDMSVTGNRYIDCLLTAGLGSHRVHHVLPGQKSGFANILSEWAVRETCKEFNVPWLETKNFVVDRLPKLFRFYMFAPMRRRSKCSDVPGRSGFSAVIHEAFSWSAFKGVLSFVTLGFWGIGSI